MRDSALTKLSVGRRAVPSPVPPLRADWPNASNQVVESPEVTRLFDHRLTPETLCLGVVDGLLSFLVVYLLCSSATSPGLMLAGPLQPEVAKAAASIALATAVLAFGIGL